MQHTARSHVLKPLATAAIAAATIGCANQAGTTARDSRPTARPQVVDADYFINNEGFANKIALTGIIEGTTPAGRKRVEAELYNETKKFQNVNYSFKWFDDQGIAVDSIAETWRTVGIQAATAERVTAIAPTERATDFELRIRPTR